MGLVGQRLSPLHHTGCTLRQGLWAGGGRVCLLPQAGGGPSPISIAPCPQGTLRAQSTDLQRDGSRLWALRADRFSGVDAPGVWGVGSPSCVAPDLVLGLPGTRGCGQHCGRSSESGDPILPGRDSVALGAEGPCPPPSLHITMAAKPPPSNSLTKAHCPAFAVLFSV